jgi:hypothetical protein
VTAYVAADGATGDTDAFDVPLLVPGSGIAYEDLWVLATAAADDAVAAYVPVPMKVVNELGRGNWIQQGEEGVASVRVFDARKGLGRWLRNEHLGGPGHLSGTWVFAPPRGFQQAKVWADTLAEVLQWHGIRCEVHARLI